MSPTTSENFGPVASQSWKEKNHGLTDRQTQTTGILHPPITRNFYSPICLYPIPSLCSRLRLQINLMSWLLLSCVQYWCKQKIFCNHHGQSPCRYNKYADLYPSLPRMCLVKLGTYITEYAAIYLTSGIEAVLEEVLVLCREKIAYVRKNSPTGPASNRLSYSEQSISSSLNADLLEKVVAISCEVWAMFQPYAHLNSSRYP